MDNSNLQSNQSSNSEDQDTHEGFIQNKILIQNNKKKLFENFDHSRPTDFATRFIRGQLILKNQPQQLFDTTKVQQPKVEKFHKIDKISQKYKQPTITLEDNYLQSKSFRLVYSRHKEKIQLNLEKDMTQFYLTMQYIMDYKLSNYSIIKPYKPNQIQYQTDELVFDSKFQSGNLIYAFYEKHIQQYHLMIQNDVNTKGYNQWFYFSVQNAKPNKKYTLKIVNYKKKSELFNQGMKPFMFSMQAYKINGIGWNRNFGHIKFEKTNLCKNQQDQKLFYSLEFTLETPYPDDLIFISMGMPYSYSKLNFFLNSIEELSRNKPFLYFKKQIISYTICNNAVPMITITSNSQSNKKKHIGIMARQHPGESWPSYLVEQIIQSLTQENKIAQYLRNNFIFKIFPMINIDGVIYGNFRCDVSGVDLNRQWKSPNKYLHPHIYDIKNYIKQSSQINNYELFFDLHGHSKKLNTFCYSCQKDPQSCRIFPLILQKFYRPFYFPDCTFGISKQKENTARAFLYNSIQKDNILTIQLSFYGTDQFNNKIQDFNPIMMRDFSIAILKSIYTYNTNNDLEGVSRESIQVEIKNRTHQFMQYNKKNENDSGSQSDPYEDQIQQVKLKNILPVKMRILIQLEEKAKKKTKQKKVKGQLVNRQIKKKRVLNQLRIDKKYINSSDRKNQIQTVLETSQIKKKQKLLTIVIPNSKSQRPRHISHKKNQTVQLEGILSKVQPKIVTVKKDIYQNKKFQFNKTVYNQLNFHHSIKSKSPKHNKKIVLPQQTNNKSRLKNDLPTKKSTQSEDQSLAKKIQQNMIPLYYQRMTMYQVNPTKAFKSRMAALHHSIEESTKYPQIMGGMIPTVKKMLQTQIERKKQWNNIANSIFPVKLNEKKQDKRNLEKLKTKSEMERRPKYEEITKVWKQNLEKYTKKLQNQFGSVEFK